MPGLYSPSAGDVLTAANAISNWSKQVTLVVTSGTRPGSPVQGMSIYQTDTNTELLYGTAWCEITPYGASVATSETTASASYVDLTTPGPAVTVATGTKAIISINSRSVTSANGAYSTYAWALSGATTLAAADAQSGHVSGTSSVIDANAGRQYYYASLTAGNNTVTMKYKSSSGTGTFDKRHIIVIGIPT